MSGPLKISVYSHYGGAEGERAFIHTSYPVREGKRGVHPRGRLLETRGSGLV